MRTLLRLALATAITAPALLAHAAVRLPRLVSDHMVLQRDRPIHLWGWADPGEKVTVTLGQETQSVVTGELGKWSLYLPPQHAGGPHQVTVSGTNSITLSDVLIGDVWFASGQSNMEMPLAGFPGSAVLKNGPAEIANANQPNLRLLHVGLRSSQYPMDDTDASWTACTPETATSFSAVAYFFGREIQGREHVPVGLIDATWGGTPGEAWVSLDALAADASLMPVFRSFAKMADAQAEMPLLVAKEQREDLAAKAANQPPPEHHWHPNLVSYVPAGLYNAMVAPETPYPIKGVIWYQGETNSALERAPLYARVFSTLIQDWRAQWHNSNLPFLYAQISSFRSTPEEDWGMVRDAQRRVLQLRNTGMAVTLDVGDPGNVHPSDKQTVAARLALAARTIAYGEKLEDSGPLFREAVRSGNGITVYFDHAAGLTARGGEPSGFEIAGADHHYVPATAHLEGDTVVVSAPSLKDAMYVRYAWANAPVANLFNGAGLPASTFTSEPAP